MQTLSRRGLLVAGGTGAAGAVLSACGAATTERDQSDDAALLGSALAAESALGDAYAGEGGEPYASFARASRERATELERLVSDAGGDAGAATAGTPVEAADAVIAAYRAAAGPLSAADLRGTAIAFLAAVAAELAALLELAGEDPVPRAFVTGGAQEPLAEEPVEDEPETTTEEDGG